jgi:lysophospholipase L1-like esterase
VADEPAHRLALDSTIERRNPAISAKRAYACCLVPRLRRNLPWIALVVPLAALIASVAMADGEILPEPMPEAPGMTPPIEHPEHLVPFYAALARTAARERGAITRVTHLGDSSIGMDGLPHFLRTSFQSDYGDAGPGYVLLQPHGPSYINRTVSLHNRTPWQDLCFIIHRCRRDGHYGLGGVTVESNGGAETLIQPREGRAVTRAELWYLAQPRGGQIEFRFGGEGIELQTRADALEDRWHVLERAAGEHPVRVVAEGRGLSRAYGVVLENEGPGVVWDTLSMVGAFTNRLLAHDESHFARQLQHRDPDLVVLNYGGNDLRRIIGRGVTQDGLTEETHSLLARVRAAVPSAGCLVVGINDHEQSGEAEVEPQHVSTVIAAQRAAAARAGCAFWDQTAAMGGPRSFAAWHRRGLASDDRKHLSPQGRRVIAARLAAAILAARR